MINYFYKIILFTLLLGLPLQAQERFKASAKPDNNNYELGRTLDITLQKDNITICRFTKKLPPHFSLPEISVFDNGNIVLLHSLEGIIEFYDSTGNLISQTGNLITGLYNEHKILYSETGRNIALLITENNKNKILIFDKRGNEKKSFSINNGIATGVVLSNNNKLIAASYYNWKNNKIIATTILSELENKKEKQFSLLFKHGYFDENGNNFIGYTNKKFFEINIKENKIILEKEITDNSLLLDVFKSSDNTYFIKANLPTLNKGTWIYPSARIVKLNSSGIETETEKISHSFSKIKFKKRTVTDLQKSNGHEYDLEIER